MKGCINLKKMFNQISKLTLPIYRKYPLKFQALGMEFVLQNRDSDILLDNIWKDNYIRDYQWDRILKFLNVQFSHMLYIFVLL